MKKNIKKFTIILLSIILGCILFCYLTLKIITFINRSNSFTGYVIHSGYQKDFRENDTIIIKSYSQFQNANYLPEVVLDKYNKAYFLTKSLLVKYIELNSGSYKISFSRATREAKHRVYLEYDIITPDTPFYTADIKGYFIIVEIDKDIKGTLEV